jgi:lipoate-protein ligase B
MRVEVRRHTTQTPWTYALLDQRQREIAREVREGAPGAILLSEVAPVITVGRRTPDSDLTGFAGTEILRIDRGGFATYHGPGQWVLFVVDRLEALTGDSRGVRRAVEGLLGVALDAGREHAPEAEIRDGCDLGVWSRVGKFAAVGVHIENRVLLHGLAVNAYPTPSSFLGLRPCGLDKPVSYLLESRIQSGSAPTAELDARFERLAESLVEAARRRFWHPS